MACILCLAASQENETNILIFSEEGEALDIKNIIEKHFWIEPKDDEHHQFICQQCWKCVLEFHQFYLKIAEAHQIFQQSGKDIMAVTDPISSEGTEFVNIACKIAKQLVPFQEDTLELTERKRVRPKFLNSFEQGEVDEEGIKNELMESEDNTIEEAVEPVKKKKRGRPPLLKRKLFRSKKVLNVSCDVLIKDELEEINIGNLDVPLKAGKRSYNDIDGCSPEERKKKYAQRRVLSQEFDKFIADNFKLTCCLCQLPMEDFSQLDIHFRDEHEMPAYVVCCGKKLFKRGVLVDHIHTHQNPEYFKCTECGKVMSDRGCLEGHMKNRHGKGKPAFKCGECSKCFYRRDLYTRHIQSHMPEEQKKVVCPECSKRFATNFLMRQHLKFVHLEAYSKICDICGKKIVGREALVRHQALHDSVPPPPIKCDLCGITLTSKYGLTRHIKAKHDSDNIQPQICPYCSKVSPNLYAHKRHIYNMHNIGRRHSCPMCEKAFKQLKVLKEHMTTHTGDILYTCPHCPTNFNYRSNMYAHIKRLHRREWEQKMLQKTESATIKTEIANPVTQVEALENALI